jgi:hypothetical protein
MGLVDVLTATVDEARLGDADGRSSNLTPPGPANTLARRTGEPNSPPEVQLTRNLFYLFCSRNFHYDCDRQTKQQAQS